MVFVALACGRSMRDDSTLTSDDAELPTALLDRYLAGECDAESVRVVEAWIEVENGRGERIARLRVVAGRVFSYPDVVSPEVVWERLRPDALSRVPAGEMHWGAQSAVSGKSTGTRSDRSSGGRPEIARRTRVPRGVWRWGAGIAGIAGVCATVALIVSHMASRDTTPAIRTYTTRPAQLAMLTLSDGTRVRLAPATQLTLSTEFGRGDRTVTLRGEAHFSVEHASGNPFIVKTGNVTTRVLGTRFDVARYSDRTPVRVTVEDGRVMTTGPSASAVVVSGMVAYVTDSTATTTRSADVTVLTSWTSGRIAFDDAPVPVVLETLGRSYGYTFRVADSSIARRKISATFKLSAPGEALQELSLLLSASFVAEGPVITLHARPTKPAPRSGAGERRTTRELLFTPTEAGR
jgi:ferric-dicitrate binding protein FerR (iron transport regulator)